jgi:hypothetical protein
VRGVPKERRGRRTSVFLAALLFCGCGRGKQDSAASPSPNSAIQFEDVTQKAGIGFSRTNGAFGKKWMPETMGGGGAFLDYDGDGWLDILLINGEWWAGHPLSGPRPTLALYRNNQDGTFTDVTHEAGLDVSLQGMGVAVGDYDNDGWPDIYVTAVGRNRLFHNESAQASGGGRRKFRDVTAESGVGDSGWSTSVAWLDYDDDGKLDLFVCHYIKWSPQTDIFCGTVEKSYCRPQQYPGDSCKLFHNLGGGKFEDVTRAAGLLNPSSKALGICVLDLDEDGWPDLVVANDMEPNSVYHNERNGTFRDVGMALGVAVSDEGKPRAGMGLDAADYRRTGRPGLAIGNFTFEGLALYDLNGLQPVSESSKAGGIFDTSYPWITFGVLFADFDNDGWPDLAATNGHVLDNVATRNPGESYPQPALLFRNTGGKFKEAGKEAGPGLSTPMVGRGVCRGDFDNDGRVDLLFIPNTGPPRLLRNTTEGVGHWLMLKLVGTKSNRDGLGAMVTAEFGGARLKLYARSGSSYLSASDSRLHIGLGSAGQADRVTVRWPSGTVESFGPLTADKIVTLTEETGKRLTQP